MRAGAELNRSSVQALSPSRGALTVNNSVIIARQHCVYRSSTDRRRMFYTLTGALRDPLEQDDDPESDRKRQDHRHKWHSQPRIRVVTINIFNALWPPRDSFRFTGEYYWF
jgi:hypothetical protein